jgi:hypothetical protein
MSPESLEVKPIGDEPVSVREGSSRCMLACLHSIRDSAPATH